ncbi:hypothetical protein RS130_06010 [Paraglaciecola aquimarina]|uniref:Uncharacterized protein n=1 Tax=Paraglaciecola aquimarina TaxID=1235557 RepID=A0ABU3SU66_9ALTE|nr:hypothetical protein [Paraglaciecola aquimarina]MDU0353544.1 hypothetical protein [Paraglaciecola aquimarina]
MKLLIMLSLLLACVHTTHAQSITDELIVALVDKHLPHTLHQEKARTWAMGTYDLTVTKIGGAKFSSTHKYLSLTVPIKVVMTGQVNRQLLGQKFLLNCSSEVKTQTRIDIEPIINPPHSKANVEVSVPIPESNLNCEGLKLPIKPLLEQLVISEKKDWELQLEQDILDILQQVGI